MLFISDEDRQDKVAMQLVDYVINKVATDVSNYCHIDITAIPEALDGAIVGMVNQYIDLHNLLPSQKNNNPQLQSLTEGDVSYSFRDKGKVYQDLQASNTITDDFTSQLKRFRKVAF